MARVTLTCGLGFGDEGKGTFVDWLSREPGTRLVVRYNGGAQAAHNVVSGERHHTFAQWGSGTFAGVPTLLSRHVLVNPIFALAEAKTLSSVGVTEPLSLLHVERGAVVTTPFHVAMNRLREMARTRRHGSCGMGIGETMKDVVEGAEDVLRVGELMDAKKTRRLLHAVRVRKLAAARAMELPENDAVDRELSLLGDEASVELAIERYQEFVRGARIVGPELLTRELAAPGQVVFEGAQGILLDQDRGFHPFTTWTDITWSNADELLTGFDGPVLRLGVLRAYATRHGAGPMVTATPSWSVLSTHDHNQWGEWQGSFRSGPLDLVATRYALRVLSRVDGLLVSNLDRLALHGDSIPVCDGYDGIEGSRLWDATGDIRVVRAADLAHQARLSTALANVTPRFLPVPRADYAEEIAARLGVPLVATSSGPRAQDKVMHSAQRSRRHVFEKHPPHRAM
jgi:adenylosuccinate synthase